MLFAAKHPERMAGLVIVDIGPEHDPRGTTRIRMEVMQRGDLLLVSGSDAARVYDVNRKKRIAVLDGAHGARFWPEPGKAPHPHATATTAE